MNADPWAAFDDPGALVGAPAIDEPEDVGMPADEVRALSEHVDARPRGERMGATWRDVDLADTIAAVGAGTFVRPAPTLGQIDGAGCLLYAGRVHLVFGIGGALKTWLAAFILAERLLAGDHVLFVDLEDGPDTLIARLMLDLGVPAEVLRERLHYKRPAEPSAHGRDELLDTVRRYGVTVAVIDSFGESLAADGINPNADEEVATWARMVARAVADEGAAVVLLDHLPKSDEAALTPIGSQRKQAAINGAAYAMQIVKAPSRESAGHVRIVCGKDRQGAYSRGQTVAELHLEPADGRTSVTLREPEGRPTNPDGSFRPTVLMERVSAFVGMNPDATTNAIARGVSGKRDAVIAALGILVDEGYLIRRAGGNNAQLHTSSRPYRQEDDAGTTRGGPPVVSGSGSYRTGTGEPPTSVVPGTTGNHSGTTCEACGNPLSKVDLIEGHRLHATCEAAA